MGKIGNPYGGATYSAVKVKRGRCEIKASLVREA